MTNSPSTQKIMTAVITGNHAFDVPAFHALFRSMPGVDFYLQDLANLVADTECVFDRYDVLLFYNMHQATPEGKTRAMLERLRARAQSARRAQGVFVMHHALLAFPKWPFWSELCGIEDRSNFEYYHDETLDIEVVDADHPITSGMEAWRMVDETYLMDGAGEDSHILLTVNHPKSMRTIAWTRQFGQARVFCLESGHDHQTFADPNFRRVVSRGIAWAAGRI